MCIRDRRDDVDVAPVLGWATWVNASPGVSWVVDADPTSAVSADHATFVVHAGGDVWHLTVACAEGAVTVCSVAPVPRSVEHWIAVTDE